MAQCYTETKPFGGTFDMYGGAFTGRLYFSNCGGNGQFHQAYSQYSSNNNAPSPSSAPVSSCSAPPAATTPAPKAASMPNGCNRIVNPSPAHDSRANFNTVPVSKSGNGGESLLESKVGKQLVAKEVIKKNGEVGVVDEEVIPMEGAITIYKPQADQHKDVPNLGAGVTQGNGSANASNAASFQNGSSIQRLNSEFPRNLDSEPHSGRFKTDVASKLGDSPAKGNPDLGMSSPGLDSTGRKNASVSGVEKPVLPSPVYNGGGKFTTRSPPTSGNLKPGLSKVDASNQSWPSSPANFRSTPRTRNLSEGSFSMIFPEDNLNRGSKSNAGSPNRGSKGSSPGTASPNHGTGLNYGGQTNRGRIPSGERGIYSGAHSGPILSSKQYAAVVGKVSSLDSSSPVIDRLSAVGSKSDPKEVRRLDNASEIKSMHVRNPTWGSSGQGDAPASRHMRSYSNVEAVEDRRASWGSPRSNLQGEGPAASKSAGKPLVSGIKSSNDGNSKDGSVLGGNGIKVPNTGAAPVPGNVKDMANGRNSKDAYVNGGIMTGGSFTRTAKPKPSSPPKKCVSDNAIPGYGTINRGLSNGNVLGSGSLNSNSSNGNGISGTPPISNEGYRNNTKKSLPEAYGTGNVYLMGESLLVKKALSSRDAEDVKNVGNDQYKKGHYAEALTLYDRAISLSPNQSSYHGNRAAALAGLGRLPEAIQACQEAIRLDPSYSRAHQRLGSLYIRLGRIEDARKHFKAAGQLDMGEIHRLEEVEKHLMKCHEARKAMNWHLVMRESDAAVVAGADSSAQAFAFKAEALLKLHRIDDAEKVISAAQKLQTSSIRPLETVVFIVQAQIDLAHGRFEEAVIAAEKAAHEDPKNAEILNLLRTTRAVSKARANGNQMFKTGKYYEASVAYGEGLERDPTNSILLCNRAACRAKLGLWEKTIEDCNAALDSQPNYTKALLRRAQSYSQLERWAEALRDYETLRRKLPGDVEIAKSLFDAQIAFKRARGEQIYKMTFGGEVEEVLSTDHFREAISSPGLAVVHFITRWSERCRQIAPVIDQLCKRYPAVSFIKVDVEDNPYLAKTESVGTVPTFKMYKNGLKVKEFLGPNQQALEVAVQHFIL